MCFKQAYNSINTVYIHSNYLHSHNQCFHGYDSTSSICHFFNKPHPLLKAFFDTMSIYSLIRIVHVSSLYNQGTTKNRQYTFQNMEQIVE